jgi:glycosyltransferase involved in cell wall biosynthesis
VYNLERFVKESIQSVLNQTIRPHEIIVVDDGSIDNSVEVISGFKNVQLIRMEKNSGVMPAFLAGIKASHGNILAFLDGDDVWMPDKLEKVLNEFMKDPKIMMVTHMHQWVDEKGKELDTRDETHINCERIVSLGVDSNAQDELLKRSILALKGVWLGSAFCIRRDALDLEEYEDWVYSLEGKELTHQDQPLAAYLIFKSPGRTIRLIYERLFKYRVYATNSSGSSVNIESALKTLNRSRATLVRTIDIVRRNPEWKEEYYKQQMKLKELEYYRELYTKRRWKAFSHYLTLFLDYWDKKQKIKETKRLIVCIFLGPSKFLQLKTKKRFS